MKKKKGWPALALSACGEGPMALSQEGGALSPLAARPVAWHLASALCLLTPHPERGDWAVGATEGSQWSSRHMGLADFSLVLAPLLGLVLTHLVAVTCKKHRIGTMDSLFHYY